MVVRILALLLGLGGLYAVGLSIVEEKTFEWIYIPIGWALSIFLVYGVFGVDLTKVKNFAGTENLLKVDTKSVNPEVTFTSRAKWLAKSKLIGLAGLLAMGIQVGFILIEVWASMENLGLGTAIAKVVSMLLMIVFLVRVTPDFLLNLRYSNTFKVGCAALLVLSFGLGFFILYIFLLWYCADEARFDIARKKSESMVAGR